MNCYDYIEYIQTNHWDIWETLKYLEFTDAVDIAEKIYNKENVKVCNA